MTKITKCLNEWNATVEALGQGKQTILIRNYKTNISQFLLYPTVSYTLKNDFLNSFDKEHKFFANKNALPKKENNQTSVKYFAKIEKLIEISAQKIGTLNQYHIWTKEHVKSYLNKNKAQVWILRVYKLKTPVMSQTNGGIKYANLKEEVSLEGIEPVINDEDFSRLLQAIKSKI